MSSADVSVRAALAVVVTISIGVGFGIWWVSDELASSDTADTTRIDSCSTITEPGRYELTRDLVDRDASTCVSVRSSDVVLDGAGHRIDGRGTFGTAGVVVEPGRDRTGAETETISNVTVRNVEVTDWDDGVRFIEVTGGRVESTTNADNRVGVSLLNSRRVTLADNVARSNRLRGISLFEESADNTLRNNTATGNDLFGIHLVEPGVRNNSLVRNSATDNEYGIVLVGARDNVLTETEANGNRIAGIWLSAASGNEITGSSVENRFYGVFLSDRSNGNVVADNSADANAVGIRLRSSDDNAVEGNTVRESADTAILLISSDGNRVFDNVGQDNARGVSQVRSSGNDVANNSVG